MKLLNFVVSSASLFMSAGACAYGSFTANVVDVGVTISGNYAYINIEPAENVSTCEKHTQVRFELDSDAKRSAMSIALAAKVSGAKLTFYFADNNCLGDSPRPSSITLSD